MANPQILRDHLDQLHTTALGAMRIRRNLSLDVPDVVAYCQDKVRKDTCKIERKGKNWYCEIDGIRLTIHANSYTIITAHSVSTL